MAEGLFTALISIHIFSQKLDASEDSYSISLEIASVDELEISKTHKVVIETQAAKKTVEFQLAMKKASAPGPEEADEKAVLLTKSY